jgi:hypothetical protein
MSKPGTQWNAVAVVTAAGSCEAARALKGRRFLSAEAPRLPLRDCPSSSACPCVYRKYADRRAGPRREDEKTGLRRPSDDERRRSRGRRSTDHEE